MLEADIVTNTYQTMQIWSFWNGEKSQIIQDFLSLRKHGLWTIFVTMVQELPV